MQSSGEDGEDDEDEDEESDEDDPSGKKSTLGKRKAPSRTGKPPKKGPEKKARRAYSVSPRMPLLFLTNRNYRWPKSGGGVRARDGERATHEGGPRKLVACPFPSCLLSLLLPFCALGVVITPYVLRGTTNSTC